MTLSLALIVAFVALTIAGCGFGLRKILDKPASEKAPLTETSSTVTTSSVEPTEAPAPVEVPAVVQAPEPAPAPAPATKPPKVSSGMVVVIDAGHQGRGNSELEPIGPGSAEMKPKVTSGTSGRTTGVAEHAVNLQVALRLRDSLRAQGVEVVMVRESSAVDVSNSERAKIGNDAGADLVVRLHCDGSNDTSVKGILMLVPSANQWTGPIVAPSRTASEYVSRAVLSSTGAQDRGIRAVGNMTGFNWSTVPTVIVEMGLMTNAEEDVALSTPAYQDKLAAGIARGVLDYLSTL